MVSQFYLFIIKTHVSTNATSVLSNVTQDKLMRH